MMKYYRLGCGALLFAMCAPHVLGSPITCVADTLANFESQGSCAIGPFTLTGFTFNDSQTGGASLVPDTQIEVTPAIVDNAVSLTFTSLTGDFSTGAGQTAQYIVEYQVDPPPPLIGGQNIAFDPGGTFTAEFCGNGMLVSAPDTQPVTCTGSNVTGIFPGRLQITSTGPGVVTSPTYTFPTKVSTEDIRLILDLGPGSTDTFFQSNTQVISSAFIPEPATGFLALGGLLALLAIRRNRSSS